MLVNYSCQRVEVWPFTDVQPVLLNRSIELHGLEIDIGACGERYGQAD